MTDERKLEAATPLPGKPEIFRLELVGRLYAPQASELADRIRKAVDRGAKNILLVCATLEALDSAALSAIIEGLKYLRQRGEGKLIFVGPPPAVERVLKLTRMDQYFPLVPDEVGALRLLEAGA